MHYKGSCHCGNVAYEVEGELGEVVECNCSICSRKGSLLWFVPAAQFKLTTPENAAAKYVFNKHRIEHRFCKTCGIHPYAEGIDPKGNAIRAINARCLEGIDPKSLRVKFFDGASL
jgi:hypothetical protein